MEEDSTIAADTAVPDDAEYLGWCNEETGCKCYKPSVNGTRTKELRNGFRIDTVGGNGGGYFTEGGYYSDKGAITAIQLRYHHYIVSIQVRYGSTWAPRHGGGNGDVITYYLENGEKIRSIVARSGSLVDSI